VRNYWSGSEAVERYFLFFSISRLADPNDDGVCPSEWEWPVRVTIIFLVFLWGIGLNHTYYLFIHTQTCLPFRWGHFKVKSLQVISNR
jgi:hypothetical protein